MSKCITIMMFFLEILSGRLKKKCEGNANLLNLKEFAHFNPIPVLNQSSVRCKFKYNL